MMKAILLFFVALIAMSLALPVGEDAKDKDEKHPEKQQDEVQEPAASGYYPYYWRWGAYEPYGWGGNNYYNNYQNYHNYRYHYNHDYRYGYDGYRGGWGW